MNHFNIMDAIHQRITLTKRGKNYVSCCPFHDEDTPSFTVSPDKEIWKCFGCGASGDVIDFVKNFDHVDFATAYAKLCEEQNFPNDRAEFSIPQKYKALYQINKKISEFAAYLHKHAKISDQDLAHEFLTKRKISIDLCEQLGIGILNGDKASAYLNANFDVEDIKASNLLNENYFFFQNRIIFPIKNENGLVQGFVGRTYKDHPIKYLNLPETPIFKRNNCLFNLDQAINHIVDDKIYVVEGVFDALSLYQSGIKNVVCTLGCQISDFQLHILKRYAKTIVLALDSDTAGIRATFKTYRKIREKNMNVLCVLLPEDTKDANDFLIKYNEQELKKYFNHCITFYDYFMKIYSRKNYSTIAKNKWQDKLFDFLSFETELMRQATLKKWAIINKINDEQVQNDYLDYNSGYNLRAKENVLFDLLKWYTLSKKTFMEQVKKLPASFIPEEIKLFLNSLFIFYRTHDSFDEKEFCVLFPKMKDLVSKIPESVSFSLNETIVMLVSRSIFLQEKD